MWIYSIFTEYIHYEWGMKNVLYLLSIKTLSFMQTGTKVKVNSNIQKNYKIKHIQITTLQRRAYINNYLSFFIFTTTPV